MANEKNIGNPEENEGRPEGKGTVRGHGKANLP